MARSIKIEVEYIAYVRADGVNQVYVPLNNEYDELMRGFVKMLEEDLEKWKKEDMFGSVNVPEIDDKRVKKTI